MGGGSFYYCAVIKGDLKAETLQNSGHGSVRLCNGSSQAKSKDMHYKDKNKGMVLYGR